MMAKSKQRFTAWLSDKEKQKLTEMAEREGTSVNFLVRTAVRQFLGLPTWGEIPGENVTVVTGHNGEDK